MKHWGIGPLQSGLALAALLITIATVWGAYAATLPVLVTIPPQAELVERIGGDRVEVKVVVPAGQDPHTFLPKPRQMIDLAKAKVYFRVGEPIEQRLVSGLSRGSRMIIVNTIEGIERRTIEAPCTGHGSHGHHHHHHHAAPDPHVWLAPKLLKVQAKHIAEALAEADPAGANAYLTNYKKVAEQLDSLDAEIRKQLAPYKGRAFFVFHPALGYFADAYGLEQEAVEIDGRSPTPRELRKLVAEARNDRIDTLFVQPQFDQRAARAVAEAIGAELVTIDPLRRDVFDNLRDIADKLAASMRSSSAE